MKNPTRHILLLLMAVLLSMPAFAQRRTDNKAPTDSVVFRGFSAHLDIASPLMGIIVDRGVITGEAQFDINLLNKFFPIVEFGYASVNVTSDNASNYRTSAPFWRIGFNYNFLKTKKNKVELLNRNYPFIGLRYGMSVVSYDMGNVPLSEGYWNESATMDFSDKNVYAGWVEILAGVRVDLAKGFTMGWSARVRLGLHTSLHNDSQLWFVPGYGKSGNAQFSFNYTVGFTYRTKFERQRMNAVVEK